MKDGRTHLAHKAEHAVDLETGAVTAVTVQTADTGDTTSMVETLIAAAEQVELVQPDRPGIEEVVGDKGYHSNEVLVDLQALGLRSYISEPDRGRRCWKGQRLASSASGPFRCVHDLTAGAVAVDGGGDLPGGECQTVRSLVSLRPTASGETWSAVNRYTRSAILDARAMSPAQSASRTSSSL